MVANRPTGANVKLTMLAEQALLQTCRRSELVRPRLPLPLTTVHLPGSQPSDHIGAVDDVGPNQWRADSGYPFDQLADRRCSQQAS
jgi:hypothetical protein